MLFPVVISSCRVYHWRGQDQLFSGKNKTMHMWYAIDRLKPYQFCQYFVEDIFKHSFVRETVPWPKFWELVA